MGWLLKVVQGREDTHGKLVLRVFGPLAHRTGVVELLHVVGFVKAARHEEVRFLPVMPSS